MTELTRQCHRADALATGAYDKQFITVDTAGHNSVHHTMNSDMTLGTK